MTNVTNIQDKAMEKYLNDYNTFLTDSGEQEALYETHEKVSAELDVALAIELGKEPQFIPGVV